MRKRVARHTRSVCRAAQASTDERKLVRAVRNLLSKSCKAEMRARKRSEAELSRSASADKIRCADFICTFSDLPFKIRSKDEKRIDQSMHGAVSRIVAE
ncbi:MAG: hypothetical protein HDT42_11685 [Ruminococcaceae bacterium]|nr:hypothetical protein [Oscillospiraceae bacterium]